MRIVKTGPGTVKMQNPTGTHDDLPTAVAMVAADLTTQAEPGTGASRVRHAVNHGPRGVNFIPKVPGAYDDPHRRL